MKKFAVMLFAGAAALVLGAAEIDVNGAFAAAKPGDLLPKGWILNNGPKPEGKHELVRKDGKNIVRINGTKSMYGIATRQRFMVKPGEKYRLSVEANADGVVANVGMFFYAGSLQKYKYLKGDYAGAVKVNGAQTIAREITIPAEIKGEVPTLVGVCFYVQCPADAEFSNFKFEKLD